MGAKWDSELPTVEMWKEALRVAKPGAHLLAFGGTRTYHRLACAIEDAGWEIRDCCFWCYGCLNEETQILTQNGWKGIGEINVGDAIIGYNTTARKFIVEPCERTYLYDYDDTAYRIQSDSTDQLVSKNHRVLAEVNGVLDFVYAETLRENDTVRVPIYCGDVHLSDLGMFIGHHQMTTARVSVTRYKGRMWCVSVPSGAIVARRNGKIFVTGNSGFPKSMDVSKAIDKMLGAERDIVGYSSNGVGTPSAMLNHGHDDRTGHANGDGKTYAITAPATPEAAEWNGYGTCLKPACEPIVVARKPLEGTVAANVLKYGTGAINIDACRVPTDPHDSSRDGESTNGKDYTGTGVLGWQSKPGPRGGDLRGRFPANLIHDGSPEVLALFPDSKGQCGAVKGNEPSELTRGIYGKFSGDRLPCAPRGDSGSAARFFYCAKASRSERGNFNDHCTVKPIALMRYLVRLVTRKGGIVLDPFMGSGTTGVAAIQEGMNFVGIERDQHYYEIASRRVNDAKPLPPTTTQEELPL